MGTWLAVRARALEVLGILLLLAGFVPVFLFCVGSVVPGAEASSMLGFFPDFSWLGGVETWLHARKIRWAPSAGLLIAIPGVLVMLLGAAIARGQQPVFDALQSRKLDARRRAHLYGAVERVEPTLGPMP